MVVIQSHSNMEGSKLLSIISRRFLARRDKDWLLADSLLSSLETSFGVTFSENILENTFKLSDGRHGLFVGDKAVWALSEEIVLATLGSIQTANEVEADELRTYLRDHGIEPNAPEWRLRRPRQTPLYEPSHRILCVGEANFSFGKALHDRFGPYQQLLLSSYEPKETLLELYTDSEARIQGLRAAGVTVSHGVDATDIQNTLPEYTPSMRATFDRIIFMFPLMHSTTSAEAHQADAEPVTRNRRLLWLFLRSAASLLAENGEIHISSKIDRPYDDWNIPGLVAEMDGDRRIECVEKRPFLPEEWPG